MSGRTLVENIRGQELGLHGWISFYALGVVGDGLVFPHFGYYSALLIKMHMEFFCWLCIHVTDAHTLNDLNHVHHSELRSAVAVIALALMLSFCLLHQSYPQS